MSRSPASILYDSSGNAVAVTLDGGVYRLEMIGKVRDSSGTLVDPATEATLAAADTKLGTIDAVLDSIKDTDGIKKITDQLPAGTNEIGAVAQGTKAAGADAWPTVLHSEGGRPLRTDAFDVLRTSPPAPLFDDVHKYEVNPLRWGTSLATGGTVTHIANQSAARVAVTGSSGSRARLRSHSYFRYQSGRGQAVRQSVYCSDAGTANQVRRWGYFDDGDGFFWELNGTTLRVVRRTSTSGSAVDNATAQSAWNIDKLDGLGPSGITLDVTKGNIYEMDFSWLGVGRILWLVNGILVHEETFANTLATPYMKTAVLPIQYEVVNTGAASAGSITNICSTVYSDGGNRIPSFSFGARNTSDVSVGTTEVILMAIRPKTTLNGVENRIVTLPALLVGETDGSRASIRLVQGATVTGGSWASVDARSGVEANFTASGFSGGVHIVQGFMPQSQDTVAIDLTSYFETLERAMRLTAFGSQTDTIVVLGVNEKAGTTDMRASLTWEEVR